MTVSGGARNRHFAVSYRCTRSGLIAIATAEPTAEEKDDDQDNPQTGRVSGVVCASAIVDHAASAAAVVVTHRVTPRS